MHCSICSSTVKSRLLLRSFALRRRNCEADHSLSARLERTSVSTCSMHRRATRVAGDLMRAASKATMMNRSKAAYRLPALQLLCLCYGGRQRQTSKILIWRHTSSSCASSFCRRTLTAARPHVSSVRPSWSGRTAWTSAASGRVADPRSVSRDRIRRKALLFVRSACPTRAETLSVLCLGTVVSTVLRTVRL